jgi:hypothetical protein
MNVVFQESEMNWADYFNTYEEACDFFGADTPAQVEAEQNYWASVEAVMEQDRLEACGPTVGRFADPDLDIPFPFF